MASSSKGLRLFRSLVSALEPQASFIAPRRTFVSTSRAHADKDPSSSFPAPSDPTSTSSSQNPKSPSASSHASEPSKSSASTPPKIGTEAARRSVGPVNHANWLDEFDPDLSLYTYDPSNPTSHPNLSNEYLLRRGGVDLSLFDPLLDIPPQDFKIPLEMDPALKKQGYPAPTVTFINRNKIFGGRAQRQDEDSSLAFGDGGGYGSKAPPSASLLGPNAINIPFSQLHRYPLIIKGTSNQTPKGKIRSFYAMVVTGNGEGLVGMGQGKAETVPDAVGKALTEAMRKLEWIERRENRTIWGTKEGKWGATKISMWDRPPGFGLRTNPYIHQVCKAAGIRDLSAKVRGSRNGMNVVKLALNLLGGGRAPLGLGDPLSNRNKGHRSDKGIGMISANEMAAMRGRKAVVIA